MSSPKLQFLYRIQPIRQEMLPKGATESEKKIIGQHFDYLKGLTNNGTVILAGRTKNTDTSSFGIVVFQAESEDAAHAIMSEDPAVKNHVFRAELFPYAMSLFNSRNFREMLG